MIRHIFKSSLRFSNLFLYFIVFISFTNIYLAQSIDDLIINYVSPLPGSEFNSQTNNIIVGLKESYSLRSDLFSKLLKVEGSISGRINGNVIISDDGKTIIFKPYNDFFPGETILVDVSEISKNKNNIIRNGKFTFSVTEYKSSKKYSMDLFLDVLGLPNNALKDIDTLPPNFPQIEIERLENPFSDNLFVSLFGGTAYPSNLIFENNGNPIYYNELASAGIDFKKQPDGTITYFNTQKDKFYALNSSYEVVDSFECDNGFETDLHELLVLPNGHAYLLGIDPRIIDMSVIVPGGQMNAQVIGFLIQEIDKNKNAVFQWKSLDYIPVTDASESVDLTAQVIDYIHSNSIEVDYDGNLLLSSRNLDEITKISRQNGEIIWRLGGKGNEFTFINEDLEFFHQHDARRISNGNLLFFDNGNLRTPQFSRIVEYELDEINLTATLIWEHRNTPDLYTAAMGSARRLANGNTIINWVRGGYITEVTPSGDPALIVKYPEDVYSYRVFKDDWQTNLFTASLDTLYFGFVEIGSNISKDFEIQNNSRNVITINEIYHNNESFIIDQMFPVNIPPNDKVLIRVLFSPSSVTDYVDTLNLRSDTETSIINSQMIVMGSGINISSVISEGLESIKYHLAQNFPNPFNPLTLISWQSPVGSHQTLKIYDLLGEKVVTLVDEYIPAGSYELKWDASAFPSGIYFYQLQAGEFVETRKMLLIK